MSMNDTFNILTGSVESNGEYHPALIIKIDNSRSHGLLHITDEIELTYDTVDDHWFGDTICPDGWIDLEEEEVTELVEELELDDVVSEYLEENPLP